METSKLERHLVAGLACDSLRGFPLWDMANSQLWYLRQAPEPPRIQCLASVCQMFHMRLRTHYYDGGTCSTIRSYSAKFT